MILSPHEIAWLVQQYWGKPEDQRVAVAVALAESGGDTNALARSTTGANIGQRDHGLFQLSGRWQGDKLAALAAPGWRDALLNTGLAFKVWQEGSRVNGTLVRDTFQPWQVFISKSYEQYLPDADFGLKFPIRPPLDSSASLETLISSWNELVPVIRSVDEDVNQIRGHFSS